MKYRNLLLQLARLTSMLVLCAQLPLSQAQDRAIRLIVPFPPGGSTDITARLLAEPMTRILGQTVIVENRGGAGGSIGMTEVAKAAPDGTIFGVATVSTHGVNPAVYKSLPYDPIKNFAPVTELVQAPGVLVVHPSLPVNNFAEFLAYLKANPDKLSFGSPGIGTSVHVSGELFKSMTGTSMQHVPYKGRQFAIPDLVGGQIQVMFDNIVALMPHCLSSFLSV